MDETLMYGIGAFLLVCLVVTVWLHIVRSHVDEDRETAGRNTVTVTTHGQRDPPGNDTIVNSQSERKARFRKFGFSFGM